MEDSVTKDVSSILQSINRHLNCLSEENRNSRKRAIEGIKKEIFSRQPVVQGSVLHGIFTEISKPLLKLISDPVEKCRELGITLILEFIVKTEEIEAFLPLIVPVITQRLGQPELQEPSEEIRFQLIMLLQYLIDKVGKKIAPFLDDIVKILQYTIIDQYPEIKKESCKCASKLAKCIPEYFHMQSETLIKPLLQSISHQHSRVRVEVVKTIGDVIQYGDGKSVDAVVSHLAQRLFDQAPTVRKAVIDIVGNWLLDLRDRYSFHYKLIPLLLTGMQDEMPDIKEQTESLWYDIGLKYENENEDDLKDKQDFIKEDPEHYPQGVDRPNLGCRTLVYRNFSKILTGISNDITDWVVDTRIKCAGLLYQLLINEEDNTTQHLDKVFICLHKGSSDENSTVVEYISKSAEIIGYFVKPEVWCKMVLEHIKLSQSPGSLLILSGIICGSHINSLQPYLHDICNILSDADLCRVADSKMQTELLKCLESLLTVSGKAVECVHMDVFAALISVLALYRSEIINDKVNELLFVLAKALELDNKHALYEVCTRPMIGRLQNGYIHWTQHSVERLIFDTLLMECGSVIGELLEEVIPILVVNLNPEKDAEVRLKFFSLLSKLVMNAKNTLDSQNKFKEFGLTVLKDIILPNCVWKAGRVAGAIRTTAVSCMWAVIQAGVLPKQELLQVVDDLVTQLTSTLEDDNKSTRLVSCRVFNHIFTILGQDLDQDKLNLMYPEFLKRMDDSSDDVRKAMCKTLISYFKSFQNEYDASLYRAYLEAIYKGLLIHLDDPEQSIQDEVYEVLAVAARLNPHLLMREIEEVQHKHRSTKYCDQLTQHIKQQYSS